MKPVFNADLYNDEFFAWHHRYAREYSIKSIKPVIQRFDINSIIDFGCGIGSYLEGAHQEGLTNLKGYDIGGAYARDHTPEELCKYIEYRDITKPIKESRYDLVLSIETAEHIDPDGTGTFVDNITSCGGLVVFTAAPPGQLGCGHINCEPRSFWIAEFLAKGYAQSLHDEAAIRELWRDTPDYIQSNLMVFRRILPIL